MFSKASLCFVLVPPKKTEQNMTEPPRIGSLIDCILTKPLAIFCGRFLTTGHIFQMAWLLILNAPIIAIAPHEKERQQGLFWDQQRHTQAVQLIEHLSCVQIAEVAERIAPLQRASKSCFSIKWFGACIKLLYSSWSGKIDKVPQAPESVHHRAKPLPLGRSTRLSNCYPHIQFFLWKTN